MRVISLQFEQALVSADQPSLYKTAIAPCINQVKLATARGEED